MENFVLNKKIKLLSLIFVIVIFFSCYFFINSYSTTNTHPVLTEEVIKFFNAKSQDYEISQKEIEWIKQGSIDEDEPPRYINHFYDPVHNVGWTGKYFGNLTEEEGYKQGSDIAPKPAISAKDWSQNQNYQSAYGRQYGNQTWQKAIKSFIDGDKKSAFIALGHILHLIEDMSVPDHTRNDSHPGIYGDPGSSYENYAKEYTNFNKLAVVNDLINKNKELFSFNNLNEAFDYLANYSNKNFFSEDTINNNDFKEPNLQFLRRDIKIIDQEKTIFLYSNNLNSYLSFFNNKTNRYSTNDKTFILSSYCTHLFPQSVLASVSVIDLFFKETEKYQNRPELLEPIVLDSQESVAQVIKHSPKIVALKTVDFFDNNWTATKVFVINVATSAKNLIQNTSSYIKSIFQQASPGSLIVDTFQFQQPQTAPVQFPQSIDINNIQPQPQPQNQNPQHSISQLSQTNASFQTNQINRIQSLQTTSQFAGNSTPGSALGGIEPKFSVASQLYPGFGGGAPPPPASEPEPEPEPPLPPPPAPPAPDTTPPDPPIIASPDDFSQPFTDSDITFIGTSEASSTISQDFDSSTTTAGSSGNWSLSLSLNQGTTTIRFFSADEAGNISSSTDVTLFIDSLGPAIDSFSVAECASSFSVSGCMVATTTLNISWQSIADDLDYYEFTFNDNTSTTTVTSTTVVVSDGTTNNFFIRAKDITGQWSATSTQIVKISLMPVIISEVAWSGTSAARAQDEWIELYNRTNEEISLDNWILYAEDGVPYINLSGPIAANDYYLIERTSSTTISDIVEDLVAPFSGIGAGSGLGNGGENLILSFASSTIDQVPYCFNWCGGLGNPYYLSMERYDPDASGSISSNWGSNIYTGIIRNGKNADNIPINGTPKTKNSISYLIAKGLSPVSSDITLTKSNSPYLVDNQFQVFQADSTLSIEPGVVIKFYNDAGLIISENAKILAQGTTTDPIVFTHLYDDSYGGDMNNDATSTAPYPGSWFGLRVESTTNNDSVFDNVIVRYGGKIDVEGRANLYVKETSALVTNSVFEYSLIHGLNLAISSSTVSNNIFRNNNQGDDLAGIRSALYVLGGGSQILNNNFIQNKRGININVNGASAIVDSNVFDSNTDEAIYSVYVPAVFINNSGSGNGTDGIVFYGGSTGITTENSTTTLKANSLPYVLLDTTNVNATSTLVIESGVRIEGRVWAPAGRLDIYGNLVVQGTNPNDVIFTSLSSTPDKGDWYGIKMYPGSTSDIRGATISYTSTALDYQDSPINLENVSIENNTLGVKALGDCPVQKAVEVNFVDNTTDTDPPGLFP